MRSLCLRFACLPLALLAACGPTHDSPPSFTYSREGTEVEVAYRPEPPARLFDSLQIEAALRPRSSLDTDTLIFELLPAQGGWSRAVDSFLVRDSSGWYRALLWVRPTQPGQFVLRWQTDPFTGFTYYLSAWYDSSGMRVQWDYVPDHFSTTAPLLVRDTMELVYQFWPQVWYRRVHFVKRAEIEREFWVITQSWQRGAGVSGRTLRATANLTFDPQYPLRTRRWDRPGWVIDTLSVQVRDTLVAWLAWSYDEFVEDWEPRASLFRSWQHPHVPEIYFQVDSDGHLKGMWKGTQPQRYTAAKMLFDTSRPALSVVKREFVAGPVDK